MKKPFSTLLAAVLIPTVMVVAGNGCSGCRGCSKEPDTEIPPPADTTPAPGSAPTVDLVIDAGDDADADASADAADASKGGGSPASFAGLRACCAALQSNAASAPPPQNMWMTAAAQYCNATVASISSPQQKDAVLAQMRTMLRGNALPTQCK